MYDEYLKNIQSTRLFDKGSHYENTTPKTILHNIELSSILHNIGLSIIPSANNSTKYLQILANINANFSAFCSANSTKVNKVFFLVILMFSNV